MVLNFLNAKKNIITAEIVKRSVRIKNVKCPLPKLSRVPLSTTNELPHIRVVKSNNALPNKSFLVLSDTIIKKRKQGE